MTQINPFDVADKVVIVTGAAGFLGSAYIEHLRNAGVQAIGWDHHLSKMQREDLSYQQVDITNEEQVRSATRQIVEVHGRIDGLVNNAALNPAVGSDEAKGMFVAYEHYDLDLFRRELEVNVIGMMACIKHIAPLMMARKSGSIVNIASEVSVMAHDHRVYGPELDEKFKSPAYTASKTAVLGLTRQWAARLGSRNVRVNALSIGGVARDGMPADFVDRFGATTMLRRMARPGEYCATLQYLLSDASSFVTGSNMIADGGKHAW